jgi:spermidine synthase
VRITASLLAIVAIVFAIRPPGFQRHRFAIGTFNLRAAVPHSFHGPRRFFEQVYQTREIRFYKDGPAGTVSVLADLAGPDERVEPGPPPPFPAPPSAAPDATKENDGPAPLSILVNGKPDSNTVHDRQTLKLTAHLPALWARQQARALVIGLGTGVTAGELSLYPDMETIAVAEISPSVVEALPHFAAFTHRVHENPRLRINHGEAFRIRRRRPEKWDLIISEPSNPWSTARLPGCPCRCRLISSRSTSGDRGQRPGSSIGLSWRMPTSPLSHIRAGAILRWKA